MKVLLEHGVDVNFKTKHGQVPIHEILIREHHRKYYFEEECRNYYNRPSRDVIRGLKLLLKYGADVDIQNEKNGATPLFLAVTQCMKCRSSAELAFIKLLLNANASVNIPLTKACDYGYGYNRVGDTPLHVAARSVGRVELIQLLLECHPDLTIKNIDNVTVLDIAKKQDYYRIIEIIHLIEEELRHQAEIRLQMYKYLVHLWAPLKILSTSPNKTGISTSSPSVSK